MSDIVASINAGFTKVAGESPSSKAPKTKKKIVNLDDLKKVQVTPEIGEIGRKIIRYDRPQIPKTKKYNKKGEEIKKHEFGEYLNIKR